MRGYLRALPAMMTIGVCLALSSSVRADPLSHGRARHVHGAGARRAATRTGRRFSSTSWTSASVSSCADLARRCSGEPGASTCGTPRRVLRPEPGAFQRRRRSARRERERYEQAFLQTNEESRRAREGAGKGDRRHGRRGAVRPAGPPSTDTRAAVRLIGVLAEVQVRGRPVRAGRA